MFRQKLEEMSDEAFQALAVMLKQRMDPALLNFGAKKITDFFAKVGNATRSTTNTTTSPIRWQDKVIIDAIAPKSSVLDLGCGNGALLKQLVAQKNVKGQGIELSAAAVLECVKRGVAVFQDDIYEGLQLFPDHSYDYVILEETLQTLERPDKVLLEMLRVGRRGFISFPNFAFWQVRLDLAVSGRMPRTGWLPYHWYDTPNIHNLSIQDFLIWAENEKINIVEGYVLADGGVRELRISDNMYAEEAILLVEKI